MYTQQDLVQDLNQKYMGTYVFYKTKLCNISEFHIISSNESIQIYFRSSTGKMLTDQFNETELEEIFVNSRFFNTQYTIDNPKNSALLYTRSPRRQWKKSLTSKNSLLSNPLWNISYIPQEFHLDFSLVQKIVHPKYYVLEEAIKALESSMSVAISENYFLALSTIGTNPLVGSMFGFVGELNKNNIVIHYEPARQGILDFLKRSKQSHNWEVI